MLSALELHRRGVVFVSDATASIVSMRGPKSVVDEARAEVLARASSMRKPERLSVPRGQCDACGGEMIESSNVRGYRSGWCELCSLARRVALKGAST